MLWQWIPDNVSCVLFCSNFNHLYWVTQILKIRKTPVLSSLCPCTSSTWCLLTGKRGKHGMVRFCVFSSSLKLIFLNGQVEYFTTFHNILTCSDREIRTLEAQKQLKIGLLFSNLIFLSLLVQILFLFSVHALRIPLFISSPQWQSGWFQRSQSLVSHPYIPGDLPVFLHLWSQWEF